MSPKPAPTARLWLLSEFENRRRKNPNFSIRAFAKFLHLSPGRLSEILAGKKTFSTILATRLSKKLNLSPDQSRIFVTMAGARKRGPKKLVDLLRLPAPVQDVMQLEQDAFAAIADWQHFAILSLINTCDFKSDPTWVAKRLKISTHVVKTSLERLMRLGVVHQIAGDFRRTDRHVTTSQDIESSALKLSHSQSLNQAINALEAVPVGLREFQSVTMAINLHRLAEAKVMIRNFQTVLSDFLECADGATEKRTEVYNLNIQLVPVTMIQTNQGV